MVSGETAPQMIWSLSRKLRRRRCPRAAVIHYRESCWGAVPNADDLHRELNYLHRVVTVKKYIRQLLLTLMREIFYRNGTAAETLEILALERCEYDFRRMIFGTAPAIIDLLHRGGKEVSVLKQELKESLLQHCEKLACGAWRELLDVPPLRRRFIASPLKLDINELRCYASPLLAYSDQGALRIVELREGSIADHPEITLMHRYYARNSTGRDPESVISCQLDMAEGIFRQLDHKTAEHEILREMNREAAAHHQELNLPLADVPVNRDSCRQCVFERFCRDKLPGHVQ